MGGLTLEEANRILDHVEELRACGQRCQGKCRPRGLSFDDRLVMLVNLVTEHLGDVPRCRVPREIDPALVFVLLDELTEHAEHLSSVLSWTVEVRDLIAREFERSGHDQAALRFLILWHGGYFTGCDKCFADLSTNGERTELIDGEERLMFLKLGEDAPDGVHFCTVLGIG